MRNVIQPSMVQKCYLEGEAEGELECDENNVHFLHIKTLKFGCSDYSAYRYKK